MKTPETFAELRANIATCDVETTFWPMYCTDCLVTKPLNAPTEARGLTPYSFYPVANQFFFNHDPCGRLPAEIANAAHAWDNECGGYTDGSANRMTRDDALAWLDAYIERVQVTP